MLDKTGVYRALVTSVTDPTFSKRVKVQCPQVGGAAELQWAEPVDFRDPVPNPGDLVWISFNGGDTTKPVYTITVDPFTWKAPVLNTGWAIGPSGGTVQLLRYKNFTDHVRIIGSVHTTSTTPNAVMFNLPSINSSITYRPFIEQRIGVTFNNAGAISSIMCQILSNGDVKMSPNPTVSGADVYFNIWFPLGNIG